MEDAAIELGRTSRGYRRSEEDVRHSSDRYSSFSVNTAASEPSAAIDDGETAFLVGSRHTRSFLASLVESIPKFRPMTRTVNVLLFFAIAVVFCFYYLSYHRQLLLPQIAPALNSSLVATMIETRNVPVLTAVLLNFLAVVPPEWPFVIWCSDANIGVLQAANSLKPHLDSGKLTLRLLPDDANVTSGEGLSRFLTKLWFWEQLAPAEYALFFQSDSILCSASSQSINDWLGYDFVGTPVFWCNTGGHGGNGGLSIRSIPTIKTVLGVMSRPDWNGDFSVPGLGAEDYWYMTAIDEVLGPQARWPEKDNRSQLEFGFNPFFDGEHIHLYPLGFHEGGGNALQYIDMTNPFWRVTWRYCPEMALILDTNAGRFDEEYHDT